RSHPAFRGREWKTLTRPSSCKIGAPFLFGEPSSQTKNKGVTPNFLDRVMQLVDQDVSGEATRFTSVKIIDTSKFSVATGSTTSPLPGKTIRGCAANRNRFCL